MGPSNQISVREKHLLGLQTLLATMERQLYERGLSSAQKSISYEAQNTKTIKFKQNDQIAGVRDIFNLIAVDRPISMVSDRFIPETQCRGIFGKRMKSYLSLF